MKIKMQLRKLDARGFSHDIGMVAVAVLFGIVGVGYLVATHAAVNTCSTAPPPGPVTRTEVAVSGSSVSAAQNCTPVSTPASTPVSTQPPVSGEQLSIPPQRRPAQYVHVCVTGNIVYVTQGTPNCLPGGTFQFNYDPSVPGTFYSVPCKTTASTSLRYVYIATGGACPAGTSLVGTNKAPGEQLSIPPQRRPVQYVHVCVSGASVYVTQGTPNCLAGGVFIFNYDSSVPGTYYSTACATNSSFALRYAYIASGQPCPAGTVLASKT